MLQVDAGGVSAGIVGAHNFDGAAIAGAVLLNHDNAVIRLLAGAETRQTNHNHDESVPFEFLSLSKVNRELPSRILIPAFALASGKATCSFAQQWPAQWLAKWSDRRARPHISQQLSIAETGCLKQIRAATGSGQFEVVRASARTLTEQNDSGA